MGASPGRSARRARRLAAGVLSLHPARPGMASRSERSLPPRCDRAGFVPLTASAPAAQGGSAGPGRTLFWVESMVMSMAASRYVGIAAGGNGKWALVSQTYERSGASLEA